MMKIYEEHVWTPRVGWTKRFWARLYHKNVVVAQMDGDTPGGAIRRFEFQFGV